MQSLPLVTIILLYPPNVEFPLVSRTSTWAIHCKSRVYDRCPLQLPPLPATTLRPLKHTLPTELLPVNGSDSLGGCTRYIPFSRTTSSSVGVCVQLRSGGSSHLVDDASPEISPGSFERPDWARGLITMRRSSDNDYVQIGFDFGSHVSLTAVEFELFNCPEWSLGPSRISVYTIVPPFRIFPQFDRNIAVSVGSLNSSSFPSSCSSTVRVCVPITRVSTSRFCHVGFSFLDQSADEAAPETWVALAETRFVTSEGGCADLVPMTPTTPTPPPPTSGGGGGSTIKRCRRWLNQ